MNKQIYLGQSPLQNREQKINGELVKINEQRFYKISNYHQMPDFFMTLVSVSDQWMFISSNGSLTAGRKNRNNALFPYYCVDKIHDYHDISGSKTVALVNKNNKTYLWEPFSKKLTWVYALERNLYKSVFGNQLIFEEVNHDLELTIRYEWSFSNEFGFVKKTEFINRSSGKVAIDVLDGLTNLLPNGFDYHFQLEYSNLLDAYKKNERIAGTTLGLFTLSSVPVDRAEPSESLFATTVWSTGLTDAKVLISENQLEAFKRGELLTNEYDIRATRGAYFINAPVVLEPSKKQSWILVAEINQDTTRVINLQTLLSVKPDLVKTVYKSIADDTQKLKQIVAKADGWQLTNNALVCARHYANTQFNVMRGGIFIDNYSLTRSDFSDYLKTINTVVFKKQEIWLQKLPEKLDLAELLMLAHGSGNGDLIRICSEYLPLTFSRRHGDPSRPWNQFSIEVENADGSVKSDYQGNWRDIFQNWEALAVSYPGFVEQMIGRFVNASTADGYNPYRIARNGIDWERPDPDDAWAFIGYWGDHQVIYLQKLLEISNKYHPGKLNELLSAEIFAYANVPYRIKPYDKILENPQDTIVFDYQADKKISELAQQMGADGKLVLDQNQAVYKVNLAEKVMVSLLTKLSNFIPEAGIWLNTQRPEWNDANNALVGNGVSMVTLYYLRRSLNFWNELLQQQPDAEFLFSVEVKTYFDAVFTLFTENQDLLTSGFSDADRLLFINELGTAAGRYRDQIYQKSFSGQKILLSARKLADFAKVCLKHIDHSIDANRRSDGMYHAYNLLQFTDNELRIRHLYEMLEGQVAVLSSGYLSAIQAADVLDALRASSMYRPDQQSYTLYPDRNLPRFLEKNQIPVSEIKKSTLLEKLLSDGNQSILVKDQNGDIHFNSTFRNAQLLLEALDKLDKTPYGMLLNKERQLILTIYEQLFDHQSFTGRSGTFFGFEGLGSIYWHMVSKLLLATQEAFYSGWNQGVDSSVLTRLKTHYNEIKDGIGLNKSPRQYGAFPTDAYSHTPKHAGAQQPGMTGQVKEDLLARFGELGVQIVQGQIQFGLPLLDQQEFLSENATFDYVDLKGETLSLPLQQNELAFTWCGVPVIYKKSNRDEIKVHLSANRTKDIDGLILNRELSQKVFARNGEIQFVEVYFKC
ncbi:MAG: hypothetical protein CVU09_13720 [Bacteroidetes bacterium HGW-Bacteroidetes-4]|jgi:Tfp pilus assembly protein PilN|nr:MAG: hypothetical protein CVU09_13720 [Bacteroidetes bacterium HGW-Bacteroidetes-4]